jgi:hypothetical protein
MMRRVLFGLVLGVVVFTRAAAAEPRTMIGLEIKFPDGRKWEMLVTDPHWIPLDVPEHAGVFLTVSRDRHSVAVAFFNVEYTANDIIEVGQQERQQVRTELGRDIMTVGGDAVQSKTVSPFRIRVTRVVTRER